MSPLPLLFVFGSVRKLLVVADDDDAHPLIVSGEFIRLDTDARVRAHPLNLLAERREGVKPFPVESEIEWHNIRLVIACAP